MATGAIAQQSVQVGDQATSLASRGANGAQGSAWSARPRISGDGKTVAFVSAAANLTPGSANDGDEDVFLKNVVDESIVRVSRTASGGDPTGRCDQVAISRNGQWIAFTSDAPDVAGLTIPNGRTQVFRYHVPTQSTVLVSHSLQGPGVGGNQASTDPDVSDTGEVVYQSSATDLGWTTHAIVNVFLWNPVTGNRLLSVRGTTPADGPSRGPRITANGSHVVYHSLATNLVVGDTNGAADILLWARSNGVTSSPTVAVVRPEACLWPTITDDSLKIAFLTAGPAFTGVLGSVQQAVLHDRAANTFALVSAAPSGAPANAEVWEANVSPDGSRVAFASAAGNLGAANPSGQRQAWLRDFAPAGSPGLRLMSWSHDGVMATAGVSGLSLSTDGLWLTMATSSPLWFSDTNGVADVFVGFGGIRNLARQIDPQFDDGWRPGILRQLRPSRLLDRLGFRGLRIRDIDIVSAGGACAGSWLLTVVTVNASGLGEIGIHGSIDCSGAFTDQRANLPNLTIPPLGDVLSAATSPGGGFFAVSSSAGTFLGRRSANDFLQPIGGLGANWMSLGVDVDASGAMASLTGIRPGSGTGERACVCTASLILCSSCLPAGCTSCTPSTTTTTVVTPADMLYGDLFGGLAKGGGCGCGQDPLLLFGQRLGVPGVWWMPGSRTLPGAVARPLYIGTPPFRAAASANGLHLLVDTDSRLWELETMHVNTDTAVGALGGTLDLRIDLPSQWIDGGGVFAVLALGSHDPNPVPLAIPMLGSPLHVHVAAASSTRFSTAAMPTFQYTVPAGAGPYTLHWQAGAISVQQGALAGSNVVAVVIQ